MNTPLEQTPEPAIRWSDPSDSRPFAPSQLKTDTPTVAIAVAILGGYVALTWFFQVMSVWIAAPLTALWLAWYSSLQHETIHNHPTQSRQLNAALGSLPLALWLPYRIYRVTHLQHHRHRGRHLTEVDHDPESFFVAPGALTRQSAIGRWLFRANCTLAGRLLLGPALSLLRFWTGEARRMLAGDRCRQIIWLRHVVASALLLLWVSRVCHISVLVYLLCVIYPSVALTHLRSFMEHRAHPDPARRTVTVETSRLWSLLFLNNNLHIAHHAYPKLSWYQLPAAWDRMRRGTFAKELIIEGGYRQVAQTFLFDPVMAAEHPVNADPIPERL